MAHGARETVQADDHRGDSQTEPSRIEVVLPRGRREHALVAAVARPRRESCRHCPDCRPAMGSGRHRAVIARRDSSRRSHPPASRSVLADRGTGCSSTTIQRRPGHRASCSGRDSAPASGYRSRSDPASSTADHPRSSTPPARDRRHARSRRPQALERHSRQQIGEQESGHDMLLRAHEIRRPQMKCRDTPTRPAGTSRPAAAGRLRHATSAPTLASAKGASPKTT